LSQGISFRKCLVVKLREFDIDTGNQIQSM
jgi:hypothetical protein